MSLAATNTSAEYVGLDPTNVAAMSSGAYTVGILVKSSGNQGLWNATAGGFTKREAHRFDGNLFGAPTDFSSGFPGVTNGAWYWVVQTKPAGDAHVRWHVCDLATLTWSHGESSGAANQSDSSATDALTIGFTSSFDSYTKWNGEFAAFAVWASELNDAGVVAAFTKLATDLAAADPGLLVLAPEAIATSPLVDVMGGAGELTRSSGWTATADPTDFNFTLDGGGGGDPPTEATLRVRIANTWVTIGGPTAPPTTPPSVWNGSAYTAASGAIFYIGPEDPGSVADGSIWADTVTPAYNVRIAGAWVAI